MNAKSIVALLITALVFQVVLLLLRPGFERELSLGNKNACAQSHGHSDYSRIEALDRRLKECEKHTPIAGEIAFAIGTSLKEFGDAAGRCWGEEYLYYARDVSLCNNGLAYEDELYALIYF